MLRTEMLERPVHLQQQMLELVDSAYLCIFYPLNMVRGAGGAECSLMKLRTVCSSFCQTRHQMMQFPGCTGIPQGSVSDLPEMTAQIDRA